ncbi:MAG: hypothetical protein Q8R28_18980 [Dehalococcoidia bacterium]|nr:hypothetical protein [Dehalococcoidia bacterium]
MGVTVLDPIRPDPLLRPRDHVLFYGNWPTYVRECPIEIGITQTIHRENVQVLTRGAANSANIWDLELNDTNGFLPRAANSLYEIRLSFKADALLYVIWPTPSTYFFQLENPTFRPDVTSDTNRYVGFVKPADLGTPEKNYQERLLRIITVKDMQPVLLRFYSETMEADDKIVIDFMINRCQLNKLPQTTSLPVFRPIYSYELYNFTSVLSAEGGAGVRA